jgi:putative redox protein
MSSIATSVVATRNTPWTGDVTSGSHHYVTDKPESFGGQNLGPAPYDFLTAGLASCTMITLRMYAQHKNLELGEFNVTVDFHANREGQEWIERKLHFTQNLSAELQQKILQICQKTPVTKTLLRSVEINTTLI